MERKLTDLDKWCHVLKANSPAQDRIYHHRDTPLAMGTEGTTANGRTLKMLQIAKNNQGFYPNASSSGPGAHNRSSNKAENADNKQLCLRHIATEQRDYRKQFSLKALSTGQIDDQTGSLGPENVLAIEDLDNALQVSLIKKQNKVEAEGSPTQIITD